ncbi:melanoma-associated antigen 10-like [Orycteropus afer afer]|uniref:Melanoma-associated antigen 10-like n=1 Tax=Orycteropus afer afer TaxID=1230840 RepID=A0A8B7ASR6_ORYAF|nr:melanoma-associated antigen 10-like [Orycteropus afer afer]
MSHSPTPKRQCYTLDQDLQDETEAWDIEVPAAEEEMESPFSSSSLDFTNLCSSSSPLFLETMEDVYAVETMHTPQSCQVTSSISLSTLDNGSSTHKGESPSTWQGKPNIESLLTDPTDDIVVNMVQFLLLKYQTKQPITKAEMLTTVLKQYEDGFPMIFKKACDYIELVFGINIKREDPTGNSYVFYNTLDLTYDGILNNYKGMPKTGLLMLTLSLIFMEGNSVTEEKLWKVLNATGVYAGREHVIYGEPRQFITRDLVQEKYLEYRQVPNSDPPCYEFLWGPRALAETSKMKVLEFLTKVNGSIPHDFPVWYWEALRDEEERAKARISPMDTTTAIASSSANAPSISFSYP